LLTGRENIYVNGAILGMSKKEIDEKFDDIVGFADIGDFLKDPSMIRVAKGQVLTRSGVTRF
jgi:lipopolysaccharide transport system ATP-binding protein